jgi:uncharacterized membrane protein (UPF0136 family)
METARMLLTVGGVAGWERAMSGVAVPGGRIQGVEKGVI